MNREMKKYLKQAYEPPKPLHKQEFLKQLPKPGISMWDFFRQQAGYIRKIVWIFSVLLFLGAWFLGKTAEKSSVWMIAAIVPFLAFVTITESMKSVTCHMEELEMSARYSMKYVVMGRIVILGAGNFLLLLAMILLFANGNVIEGIETGMYLLVPYLLTATLGLSVLRKIRGRESVYFCMGIAVCVSGLELTVGNAFLHQERGSFWLIAAGILLIGFVRECICTVKQTEEYVWN